MACLSAERQYCFVLVEHMVPFCAETSKCVNRGSDDIKDIYTGHLAIQCQWITFIIRCDTVCG